MVGYFWVSVPVEAMKSGMYEECNGVTEDNGRTTGVTGRYFSPSQYEECGEMRGGGEESKEQAPRTRTRRTRTR
eukprot:692844-Hanusia_phi.AAC.3